LGDGEPGGDFDAEPGASATHGYAPAAADGGEEPEARPREAGFGPGGEDDNAERKRRRRGKRGGRRRNRRPGEGEPSGRPDGNLYAGHDGAVAQQEGDTEFPPDPGYAPTAPEPASFQPMPNPYPAPELERPAERERPYEPPPAMASSHAPYVVTAAAAVERPPAPSYHAPMAAPVAPPSEPPSPEPPPRRPPEGVDIVSVDQAPENPRKGWWRRLGK